jgi:hypothetical protein
MRGKLLQDPDQVTAHLRELGILVRDRAENGPGMTRVADLGLEVDVLANLLETQRRMAINAMGRVVGENLRRSLVERG